MLVYLATCNVAPFLQAIEAGLGRGPQVSIRRVLEAPARREDHERSLVILDLEHPPAPLGPPPASPSSTTSYIIVIAQGELVPVEWVEFLRLPAVELVTIRANESTTRYAGLAAVLARHRGEATPARMVEYLAARRPPLAPLSDLAAHVLTAPWKIRDPVDLARSARIREPALRERCEAIGLKRVEHFITMVRRIGLEFLTTNEHMRLTRARTIVGIGDPSNFRRQLRRTGYFTTSE